MIPAAEKAPHAFRLMAWLCPAVLCCASAPLARTQNAGPPGTNKLMFHGGQERLGWNASETNLTPAMVSSSAFRPLWNSPAFDSVMIGGRRYQPHVYASPLYVDNLTLSAGPNAGSSFSAIFAATSNGYVYAVNAFTAGDVAAGAILWNKHVCVTAVNPNLDFGLPVGILSTPAIDLNRQPPRLYAACHHQTAGWLVFALNLTNGNVMSGWPVAINDRALAPVNRNGPAGFQDASLMSQRGALNLSPDGQLLYVPFGGYSDKAAGWMVAIDTGIPRIASAFSAAPSTEPEASGGVWGPGGPAVDAGGLVYATTGNSPDGSEDARGVWGESLLVWDRTLKLVGTYTPFNYCPWDTNDIDLGANSPILIPDLVAAATGTPHLVAFGSKAGSVYLVDRDHLPGRLDRRPPCSTDSTTDGSLLPPGPQPQFGARGPLQVFGPYSDVYGQIDAAKMRSTPAYFQGADGAGYLFVSGSTKVTADGPDVTPPSVVRLQVVPRRKPGAGWFVPPGSRSAAWLLSPSNMQAYLSLDAKDDSLRFLNPGSPVVSSNGSENPIVWVLDANLLRSQPLGAPDAPHPVLHALDAGSMTPLWRSTPAQLNVGGKYGTPLIAHGVVFVGTDRIQAFGLH